MAASEAAARKALDTLKGLLPPAAGPQLAAAAAALDRFKAINAELVTLSRRNSNVRSLALSLGRKRTVTAECDDTLHALEEALSKHDFTATDSVSAALTCATSDTDELGNSRRHRE